MTGDARYREILQALRQAFPQPVSDRVHDAYFAFSFMRALDKLDDMKSEIPLLGHPEELDFETARTRRMGDDPLTVEQVSDELVEYLSGMFVWGHPRSQINVTPVPSIPSIVGGLLPAIYNPNLVSDESARKVAVSEVEAVAMSADLVGYDASQAGGVFSFGGTATLLYGLKIGLEKACPNSHRSGLTEPVSILCSEQAHYAVRSVANWLGVGEDNVVEVPSDEANSVRTCLLQTMLRDLLRDGRKVAGIVATMGTTDAFGLDDLQELHAIRDEAVDEFDLDYVPQLHADSVIGWAWSVFDDYDLEENALGFRPRTVRAIADTARRIRHLPLADSLGIDFHKTGFAPYVSSAFLVRDAADLNLLMRDQAATPYLFQSGHYHPGKFTLETSRGGGGPLAALANLRLFGRNGLRALLGHLVTMCETLREHLEGHAATTVCNRENYGLVTLFRVYPDGVDTFSVPDREREDPAYRETLLAHNAYNRRIFELVQSEALEGRGVVISMTDCYRETDYGEPITALKSYVTSPFADEEYVQAVLESIWRARRIVAEQERT